MKKLLLIVGLILAALLAFYCTLGDAKKIDGDITSRLSGKMAGVNLPGVNADVNGRDVTLTGIVESESLKKEAEQTAKSLYGVRVVDNQLTVKAPVIAVIEEPAFQPEPLPFPEPEVVAEPELVVNDIIEPELLLEPVIAEPVMVACQNDLAQLLEAEKINFASSRATIKQGSYGLLNRLATAAKECKDAVISINGYTDSSGDLEGNRQLSLSRAKSVGRYLMSKGVRQEIRVVGHGPNDPIADNATSDGRAQNRRIEFKVFKK